MTGDMHLVGGGIPNGYRVEETDEYVMQIGTRFLRRRAEALAATLAGKYHPQITSFHLRVEKIGPFLYEVAAYQNRLVKI